MGNNKYAKVYFFDFVNPTRERKQKNHSRKLLRRSLSSNKPSCENDAAKIQINRKKAIGKLRKLKKVIPILNRYTVFYQISRLQSD